MTYLAVIAALAILALAYQQFSFSRLLGRERDEAARERASLLQRIQDPSTANAVQAQTQLDVELPRHYVEFDDDEDFDIARKMISD